jgi:23S rRNA pseudouridine2605 synthase
VSERIQKLLATAGLGSRRGIEDWLRAGRVTVNGVVAGLGDRASPADVIAVDGRPVDLAPAVGLSGGADAGVAQVLLYHKPVGEVTTRSDPQGRPTVFDRLPAPRAGRWVVIGRLDVNTSGLLLFTNDGALAHRFMHPSFELSREYLVRVRGEPAPAALAALRRGVVLEDGPGRFDSIVADGHSAGHAWFRVTLHEGRNREVRRLWEAVGHEVSRLKRLAYGPFRLPDGLPAGRWGTCEGPALDALLSGLPQEGSTRPG